MAATPSPPLRRRRLGLQLRRLREQARLTCEDVGQRLDCSGTRISRIETGRIGARPGDVRELLAVYGVTGAAAEPLVQLAREARRRAWWERYGPAGPPWFETYLSLAEEAAGLREFAGWTLPGLVQTADYARAVLAQAAERPATSGELDRQVALRQAWQARLGQPGTPPLTLVVSEAALRGGAGGPQVMRAQLARLLDLGGPPAISLQVLPLGSGPVVPALSPFTILDFPGDPPMVYLEHLAGCLVLEAGHDVDRYSAAFGRLQASALTPDASADLIRQLAR
jgi:transcriptional regulator with XRE-family HTH domain